MKSKYEVTIARFESRGFKMLASYETKNSTLIEKLELWYDKQTDDKYLLEVWSTGNCFVYKEVEI